MKSTVTCENNNKSLGAEERYFNPFFKGQDFHSTSMLLATSIAPLAFPLSLSLISGRGWERGERKLAWNSREESPGDLDHGSSSLHVASLTHTSKPGSNFTRRSVGEVQVSDGFKHALNRYKVLKIL